MKRFLLAGVLMLSATLSWGVAEVWKSSHTQTVETAANLCGAAKGTLHSVCVGRADVGSTAIGPTIQIFDSRGVSTSSMTVLISTSVNVAGCMDFDVKASSGLTYTTTGSQSATFMYLCGY